MLRTRAVTIKRKRKEIECNNILNPSNADFGGCIRDGKLNCPNHSGWVFPHASQIPTPQLKSLLYEPKHQYQIQFHLVDNNLLSVLSNQFQQ